MIRPLADRIVVQPLDPPLSTTLTVVQLGRDGRHTRGKILATGPGKRADSGMLVPLECKVGDIIHFTDAFKFPIILDHGLKCLILQEADIAGVEEDGRYATGVANTQQAA